MPQSLDLASVRGALDKEAIAKQSEPYGAWVLLARAPERDEQRKLLADQLSEAFRGPGEAGGCVGPPVPQTVEQPVLFAAESMREAEAGP